MSAALIASVLASAFCAAGAVPEGLVLQDLDYSENPVDIPNPDRGFYRANDGMVVPVEGEGEEGTQMEVGAEPVTVARARITGPGANCFILSSANNVTIRPGETNADTWAVTPRYGLPAAEFSAVLELILDDGRIFELPFTLSVLKG